MTAKLTLTVPEAAASIDIIQFKLVLGGNASNAYIARHEQVQCTAFRSFQQVSWLHESLSKAFPHVMVPPLPEPPVAAGMDDQDYVERKRLQVGRFFAKLIQRSDFAEHPDFVHFLSSDMAAAQVGRINKGVLSFLRFNRAIGPGTGGGFKSYKATEQVEGDDQDTFHRHQIYILMLENYFGALAESLLQMIHNREGLGDTMAHMGDLVIEITQSKYRLGTGRSVSDKEAQRALDRRMQLFGLLMDELGFIFTRQGKEETMRFGDVMVEYKNSMEAIKTVFNVRTDKLVDYVNSVKQRNKKRDRADRLKLRMGLNTPEVQAVLAEESEATEALEAARQDFDACQTKIKEEIKLFETQKQRDVTRAIRDYVNVNLRFERAELQSLEKTLEGMRHLKPKPTSFGEQWPVNLDDEELSSSSSSYCAGPRRRRSRKKKTRAKTPQKALQSSTSMPTWTRKVNRDEPGSDGEQNTPSSTTLRRGDKSPVAEKGSRRAFSASYDGRHGLPWIARTSE